MDDKFLCGVVLGMLGGAVVATHSQKTRDAIKSGEKEVKEKVEDLKKTAKKSK